MKKIEQWTKLKKKSKKMDQIEKNKQVVVDKIEKMGQIVKMDQIEKNGQNGTMDKIEK